MDLSGKLIAGSGQYEVKEIAPPVESGQLLLNNLFATWTGLAIPNDYPTSWNIIANDTTNYIINNYNGVLVVTDGVPNLRMYQNNAVVSGRHYRITGEAEGIPGGGNFGITIDGGAIEGTVKEDGKFEMFLTAGATILLIFLNEANGAVLKNIYLEEVPEGYPLLDKGTKFLECTSAGTVAFPSDQAYGEGRFKLYKGTDTNLVRVLPIASVPKIYSNSAQNGYLFQFDNAELIQLYRVTNGSVNALFQTAASYIENNTWYDIKWERTLDGEMTWFIMGGSFGTDDWTIISVTSGSNPVTDNTHTESTYFVIDNDIGDKITGLITKKGVEQ